jgi:DNA-binding transcriptional LysR family regulator
MPNSYAKRLLDLNDEAVDRLCGTDLEGWARLGLAQDFTESWLPAVLKRFSRANPKVLIEVQVGLGAQLIEKTLKGDLDIALVWGDGGDALHAQRVGEMPIRWVGPPDWPGLASLGREPLPLAAFAPPCTFRSAAVAALDEGGVPWRLVHEPQPVGPLGRGRRGPRHHRANGRQPADRVARARSHFDRPAGTAERSADAPSGGSRASALTPTNEPHARSLNV